MDKFLTVAQVVAPIFATIVLGILSRRKRLVTPEGVQGFQQFVMKIGLPCVVLPNAPLTKRWGHPTLGCCAMSGCGSRLRQQAFSTPTVRR